MSTFLRIGSVDVGDIALHIALSLVLVCAISFLTIWWFDFIHRTLTLLITWGINLLVWSYRELRQWQIRYAQGARTQGWDFWNHWSDQKRREGVAAPAFGGGLGIALTLFLLTYFGV